MAVTISPACVESDKDVAPGFIRILLDMSANTPARGAIKIWTDESMLKQPNGDVHVKAYAVIVEDELLIRTVLADALSSKG